jgi:hypothetical protein
MLPPGFYSWTQVLTDWGVSRAFSLSGLPPCLKDRPELAVPFAAEIGAAIRNGQLHRRATEAALIAQQVTEPTYDEAGGHRYQEIRAVMEKAQERFFASWLAERNASPADSPDLVSLHAEKERCQAAFERIRQLQEPAVQAARAAAVRAHWTGQELRGIPDTFFADVPAHTAPARLQRIHPPWWGAFLGRLQQPFAHGHPAEGFLLDALPALRAAATKKTLAALIDEWRAEQNDKWGWYGKTHYRMLARRAAQKAQQLTRWCNTHAPGYLEHEAIRFSLHADLAVQLTTVDPWSVPQPQETPGAFASAHWRN